MIIIKHLNTFYFMTKYPQISSKDRNIETKKDLLDLMSWDLIEEFRAFVFEKNDEGVKIAAINPGDKTLRDYVKKNIGKKVEWFLATEEDMKFIFKNHTCDFGSEINRLASNINEANENISKVVDKIIEYAVEQKASDIHIEPGRNEVKIRFRLDGVLKNMIQLQKNVHSSLVARIKILANLKIDEYRRAQDGRIEPEKLQNVSLRVSIMPTLFGEKIAMRILDDSNKNLLLKDLGFSDKHEKIVMENIEKPYGMIISSGPTGSGKTTTLYALLMLLKKEGVNVSTLEDPIEYTLPEVNQIQINPRADLTFASGVRSLLRQDPNIIMVGEIRDSETAIMAADSALTGHLVLTTLHTNDAASAFIRLLEMKVEDFVASSTINLIIAQRLVRKICSHCAINKNLDKLILEKIHERKDVIESLERKEKELSKKIKNVTFKTGKGCKKCLNSGYQDRIGIYEILVPNKEIHDLVLKHASTEKIKDAAIKNGFHEMIDNGLDKVFDGVTTFEEILRVTKNI
ncbi:GspE/PulE family protein [Patescibacteria group bacterium]